VSDFDLARSEASIRLADAARSLDAALDRLRVEAFNARVCGKLALSSSLSGEDVPNEEMLLTAHAALVEVDGLVRQAFRAWSDLGSAGSWWATVNFRPPFYPDLEAFYGDRRSA